jgi:hypothetical protein
MKGDGGVEGFPDCFVAVGESGERHLGGGLVEVEKMQNKI